MNNNNIRFYSFSIFILIFCGKYVSSTNNNWNSLRSRRTIIFPDDDIARFSMYPEKLVKLPETPLPNPDYNNVS